MIRRENKKASTYRKGVQVEMRFEKNEIISLHETIVRRRSGANTTMKMKKKGSWFYKSTAAFHCVRYLTVCKISYIMPCMIFHGILAGVVK